MWGGKLSEIPSHAMANLQAWAMANVAEFLMRNAAAFGRGGQAGVCDAVKVGADAYKLQTHLGLELFIGTQQQCVGFIHANLEDRH